MHTSRVAEFILGGIFEAIAVKVFTPYWATVVRTPVISRLEFLLESCERLLHSKGTLSGCRVYLWRHLRGSRSKGIHIPLVTVVRTAVTPRLEFLLESMRTRAELVVQIVYMFKSMSAQ